jgi:hypothetical protein
MGQKRTFSVSITMSAECQSGHPDRRSERQLIDFCPGRGWFKEYDRRLILAFGPIHGEVGVVNNFLGICAVVRD